MTRSQPQNGDVKVYLIYHFSRLQLPAVELTLEQYERHVQRMFEIFRAKNAAAEWDAFVAELSVLDVFTVCGCLLKDAKAWEVLFSARAGRADRLLIDALRSRAVRLYPRNEEKQESVLADFWGHLLIAQTPNAMPVLARYDGQRPLVPWLIRVFQNWQISQLRSKEGKTEPLADDDLLPDPMLSEGTHTRWRELFCDAARAWMSQLGDQEILLLGLRTRYRMSQREAAELLGVHEGTISRQITQLRDRCLQFVGDRLLEAGWEGDDLSAFIQSEMAELLMDEPRMSAENLARLVGTLDKKAS